MFAYQPSFVRRGAVSIAYYDIGQGKPLVLLHGNGEDSSYWTGQIAEFTRFYRVIAVTAAVTVHRAAAVMDFPLR